MAIPLSARRAWPTFLLLLSWTGTSPAVSGDRPDFTYRTNATEVRVTFSATDQNDHGVATLQASDFAVVDKGFIVRDFQSFTRSDSTKLEIAILIDSSESASPRFHKEIADTLDLLAQTSGVPEENISLLSFHNVSPLLICAGDCRASHATDKLSSSQPGGQTPLYDAIVFASEFLAERGDAQTEKVLILFSDGQDTISRNSFRDALDSVLTHQIQMYGIDVGTSALPAAGTQVLRAFAKASGGRYFRMEDGANRTLNAILEGFHANYIVIYRLPSHARGFHDLQILPTHNLNLQFRSRSGYYYPNYIR